MTYSILKMMAFKIADELQDAESYAKKALIFENSRPELARAFRDLANDELRHSLVLSNQADAIITESERAGEPLSDHCKKIISELKEMKVDKYAEVKMLLAELK